MRGFPQSAILLQGNSIPHIEYTKSVFILGQHDTLGVAVHKSLLVGLVLKTTGHFTEVSRRPGSEQSLRAVGAPRSVGMLCMLCPFQLSTLFLSGLFRSTNIQLPLQPFPAHRAISPRHCDREGQVGQALQAERPPLGLDPQYLAVSSDAAC